MFVEFLGSESRRVPIGHSSKHSENTGWQPALGEIQTEVCWAYILLNIHLQLHLSI